MHIMLHHVVFEPGEMRLGELSLDETVVLTKEELVELFENDNHFVLPRGPARLVVSIAPHVLDNFNGAEVLFKTLAKMGTDMSPFGR